MIVPYKFNLTFSGSCREFLGRKKPDMYKLFSKEAVWSYVDFTVGCLY